jgi:hypothetical protein
MNWENIKSQARKLAIANGINMWMTKFSNVNVHFSPQQISNCIVIEPYNITTEYVITTHISMSIILDSNNVDAQNQILLTHEFHSLFQKMNNEQCFIFYNVMFRKEQNSNEPFHLFIIGGVHTSKTLKLMLFIQGLLCAYNKHPQSNLAKKKTLLMACTGKTTFVEPQFIQVFLFLLIVRIYHH